ncbi:hypothetical protein MNEG_14350 [Monoraphidium neglectum]|uniref:Uncharacterized protein n=1 Tax=Monoraphidium neglectum TaxID=145388 RepID=A0A0D2KCS0_9CHLO|nr:hypothetical protein MNEG_14350 [Monoraphidium neglectum]KIY93613.1 hypothetical protein MNEG_14350 [Monoraphidium neglectum]|eukprot:XP_013892633.1 hypothetical protein MNEG_14350 [Monoraphidium neglectum]
MEDCKNLFGPYGDLLFMGDVLPEPLRTLWRLLRTAARHYIFIGNPEETFTTRARQDARRALRQFAIMIERDDRLPRSLLSYTLHMMLCRLYDQEDARGMVGLDGEWWIERGVALFKDLIAGRQIVRGVEKVAAHSLLLRDALAEQLLQHPELAACQQPAQAVATAEAAASASGRTAGAAAAASSAAAGSGIRGRRARRSAAPDSFAPGRGGCRMLDAGHQVRREAQRDEARSVLTTFFTAMAGSDVDGWTLPAAIEAVNSGRLRVFKRAHMPHDGGDVTSSEYRRSRSRVSCFVRQTWEDSGSLPYICDVVRLVLLEPPTATAAAPQWPQWLQRRRAEAGSSAAATAAAAAA